MNSLLTRLVECKLIDLNEIFERCRWLIIDIQNEYSDRLGPSRFSFRDGLMQKACPTTDNIGTSENESEYA